MASHPSEASANGHERITFMDCPFDSVTMPETVRLATSWCRHDRTPHTLMTINAALLVMMSWDAELGKACRAGDLIVADGVPVVWASRLAGTPLRARVAGVDLMAALLAAGDAQGLKVFFLGAREEVVKRLVDLTVERYPGLKVVGYRNGYFKEADHAEIVRQIRESGADMLFVGMPSPFKEVWCEKYRDQLNVPMMMGVGGSFDVLAGAVRRAPPWMQGIGMEWFWRLMMEPRKMWKRYLVTNSVFIARLARDVAKNRLGLKLF